MFAEGSGRCRVVVYGMRRLGLLGFTLLLAGCQSPEKKACVQYTKAIAYDLSKHGVDVPDDPDAVDKCLSMLESLRADTGATDEEWAPYLECMTEIESLEDALDCQQPLMEAMIDRQIANIPELKSGE